MTAVSEVGRNARLGVALTAAATIALYFVPYGWIVIYPLFLLSTYAHEMGHGLAAIVAGGSLDSFTLHADGSGLAQTSGELGRVAHAWIAAGGLVGPAILGALFFAAAARKESARVALTVLGVGMLVSCVFVVRGLFAWFFVAGLGTLFSFIALRARAGRVQVTVAFLAAQLALSVYARRDYLFSEWANTADGLRHPSDVTLMADALFLPYWMWGGVCAAASFAALAFGLYAFFRATRRPAMLVDVSGAGAVAISGQRRT